MDVSNNVSKEEQAPLEEKPVFLVMPLPSTEFMALNRMGKDKKGQIVPMVCPCHKLAPIAIPVQGLAGMQVQYQRMECSTQCLRATIVERDGKPVYRMDCEANILELELQPLKKEEPQK